MTVVDRPTGAARFVGASVPRREDPRLLRGGGRYTDDIVLPGMVHAAVLRSPIARGRITQLDTTEAAAAPGVVGVLTGRDGVPAMKLGMATGSAVPAFSALAVDDVRYVGDPIAIVVAESRALAEDAVGLIDVDFEALSPVVEIEQAVEQTSERVHPDLESNVSWTMSTPTSPELEDAFAGAAHVVSETVRQNRYVPAPMECRASIADWDARSSTLTLHTSTQSVHLSRTFLAEILELPETSIRIVTADVGGSFGQKAFLSREEVAVAWASMRLRVPIKWVEDRQENLMCSQARDERITVRVGVDAEGHILAAQVDVTANVGTYPYMAPEVVPMMAALYFSGPYRIPHLQWTGTSVYTNTSPHVPYRGPWMVETTGREVVFDLVAREIGMDPAEFRRRNILTEDEVPTTTPSGIPFEDCYPLRAYEAALNRAQYEEMRARQTEARKDGRYLGIGLSSYVEPTGPGSAGARSVESATIRIEPSGRASVLLSTGSQGQGVETTMAQIAADELGIPLEDITVLQGDSSVSPYGKGTGGSAVAPIAGGVVRLSAGKIRQKLLAIAAHMLECAVDDLEVGDGAVSVVGSPSNRLTIAELATVAYDDLDKLPADIEPGLEETSRYRPPPVTLANATHVCLVEVDPTFGLVKILDYVVGEDCGVMINPMIVEGQVAGGVVQGIGGVLLEDLPYDEDGNPQAVILKDYLLPTAELVPTIRFAHVETPGQTPGGHKGVGEGGAIGAPAAVINAVADALSPFGARVTTLPITPERVLQLIDGAH